MITFARRTSPLPAILSVADASGPVSGLAPTLRVRDGATTDSYLDFADATFKAAGWTTQDQGLAELEAGAYAVELDVAGIVGIDGVESLVLEYHDATGVDASEVVVLEQLATVALELTVAGPAGGETGLTATVRLRDSGSGQYLDFADATFKAAGWVTRDAPMTEIGRGHYHRTLDYTALIGGTGEELVAEYETAGAIAVAASERIAPLYIVGADAVAPTISNFDPPVGTEIQPGQSVAFDVADNLSAVSAVVLLARFTGIDVYEVIHDGTVFGPQYKFSSRVPIVGGWHYTLHRKDGWPREPLRVRAVVRDTAGNVGVVA